MVLSFLLLSNLLAGLASVALAQSPPGFLPSTTERLLAAFDSGRSGQNGAARYFTPGALYSRSAVNISAPRIYLQRSQATPGAGSQPPTYIILAVDPDAPSSPQILHWLQPGLRPLNSSADANELVVASGTPAIAPYRGPAPPNPEPHRYIFLLFRQPDAARFVQPPEFAAYANGTVRQRFDAAKWAEAAGLGKPVAGTWFLTGRDTVGDGTVVPGGSGGNGSLPTTATTTTGAGTPVATVPPGTNMAAKMDSQMMFSVLLGVMAVFFGIL